MRRRGRVVEGARLESVYRGDSIVGSNPTVSAIIFHKIIEKYSFSRDYKYRPHYRPYFLMGAFYHLRNVGCVDFTATLGTPGGGTFCIRGVLQI